MKLLIACEESQAVCTEFRNRGFEAYSCDIIDCSGGHPEWHIKSDVLPLLSKEEHEFETADGIKHYVDKWDAIIAFPPCTDLAASGAMHFEKKRADGRQKRSIEFFCKFLEADCDYIAVENPVNIISGDYVTKWFSELAEEHNLPKKPDQHIHPWMFGDNFSKNTCLWLKGLPQLIPEVTEEPELEWVEFVNKKTGKKKRQPKWYMDALKAGKDRAKIRSKTFPGIARAMAEQWGDFLKEELNEGT